MSYNKTFVVRPMSYNKTFIVRPMSYIKTLVVRPKTIKCLIQCILSDISCDNCGVVSNNNVNTNRADMGVSV
jgi:hypothetical protein